MKRLRPLFVGFAFLLLAALTTPRAAAVSTIVIDAGHGGHDRGGVPGQKFAEKTVVLDLARRLQSKLRAAGFKTVMTRDSDDFISLGSRCATANRASSAAFVSVHTNSAPRLGADGVETYYYSGKSARLANSIHGEVVRAAGTLNRGVRTRGFYVIRNTRIPAVLCEVGFLTNPEEGRRLATSSGHRDKIAAAIARGVVKTFR